MLSLAAATAAKEPAIAWEVCSFIGHSDRRNQMPRIVVTTEPRVPNSDNSVLLDERIATADLDSDHFAAQLIERIGWALIDADGAERQPVIS